MNFIIYLTNNRYFQLVITLFLLYCFVVHINRHNYLWASVDIILALGNFYNFIVISNDDEEESK